MAELGYCSTSAKYSVTRPCTSPAKRDFESEFRDTTRRGGLELPAKIFGDGLVHRFATNGKPGDDAGAYVLHLDGVPCGWAEDHRNGKKIEWTARGRKLGAVDRKRLREEMAAAKAKREAEQAERRAKSASNAARRWQNGLPLDNLRPGEWPEYLQRKGVRPHGTRLYQGTDARYQGAIMIPVRRDGEELTGLQFISPDGRKLFQEGTHKAGGSFIIGELRDVLCIVEGFATGATIHETTGHACAVAFDAGNLLAVAKAFEGFPGKLVVCGDDDWKRKNPHTGEFENIGLDKAREAAAATGANLAVPEFGEDRGAKDTDFNDLARLHGAEAVRRSIDAAASIKGTSEKGAAGTADAPPPEQDTIRAAVRAKYHFDGDPVPQSKPDLIKGLLPSEGTGLLNGQSGAGKTFLAIDLAFALATKGEFFGKPVRQRVATVIIAAEGSGKFYQRIDACKQHRNLNGKYPVVHLPFSGDLNDNKEFERLINELIVVNGILEEDYGVPLGLVVLDTISATFAMENQNDAAEVVALCKRLKQLAAAAKVFALGVHHLGKDETRDAAGSFAWRGTVDVMYSAIATGERVRGIIAKREFCISKNRDGAEGVISEYKLVEVELGFDEDGDPIRSMAIQPLAPAPAKKRQRAPSKGQLVLSAALDECAAGEAIKHRVNGAGLEVDAVSYTDLRNAFIRHYGGAPHTAQVAFGRAYQAELSAGRIGEVTEGESQLVWRAKNDL